uniref:CCHC-type domain-containing protein n=1 Tax=Nothobranchius furzeri TaxID=105023 RepID=A0A8C6LKA3_NOTFU
MWVKRLQPTMTESASQRTPDPMSESLLPTLVSTLTQHEKSIQSVIEQLNLTNQRLIHLDTENRQLWSQLGAAASSISSPPPAPPLPVPPAPGHFRVADSPTPDTFSGEPGRCRSFLLLCDLVFKRSPDTFSSDPIKISFIVGLLRGKALLWAEARSRQPGFLLGPLHEFLSEFSQIFDTPDNPAEIARKIWSLRQGRLTVLDFAIEFRTLASISTLDDASLRAAFSQSLSDDLQDQLAFCPDSENLESLISLASRIERRLKDRRRVSRHLPSISAPEMSSRTPVELVSQPEPMQLGRAQLTPEEKLRRRTASLCLYCGQAGHMISHCPVRPKDRTHQ